MESVSTNTVYLEKLQLEDCLILELYTLELDGKQEVGKLKLSIPSWREAENEDKYLSSTSGRNSKCFLSEKWPCRVLYCSFPEVTKNDLG